MSDLSIVESYDDNNEYSGLQFQVVDGQIQFSNGLEALRQKIRNTLSIWVGTWFMDINFGIDYRSAMVSSLSNNLLTDIQTTVLNIPFVDKIISIQSGINNGILDIFLEIKALNKTVEVQHTTNLTMIRNISNE